MKIKVELVDQHFKDLRDQSHFDARIAYQIDGVRFIFMGFLQSELVDNRRLWNNHLYVRFKTPTAGHLDFLHYFSPTPDAQNLL